MFNCERASFVFIDRFNKRFFRIIHNTETDEPEFKKWSIMGGFSGCIVIAGCVT